MDTEALSQRVGLHSALADAARLRIVDTLTLGDAAPSELARSIGMPSNLVAHHLAVLERAGILARKRSEGDRRRSYVQLVPGALDVLSLRPARVVPRVLFVCSHNSARSHLAAALWRRASAVPAASAGTHPADRINPSAVATADRHGLHMPSTTPQHIDAVHAPDDFIVSVCDRAHEELDLPIDIHWSVPEPVGTGSNEAFEAAYDDLAHRVTSLAQVLDPA